MERTFLLFLVLVIFEFVVAEKSYLGAWRRPLGVWPLNAAYGAQDISGNGNHATESSISLTTGPLGYSNTAYQFAGTAASYLAFPNNGKLDAQYSFTFAVWLYPQGNIGPILNFNYGNDYAMIFWNWPNNEDFLVSLHDRSTNNKFSTSDTVAEDILPLNKWTHIAAVYDYLSGNLSIYKNGQLYSGSIRNGLEPNYNYVSNPFNVGQHQLRSQDNAHMAVRVANSGDSRYFNGRASCLHWYDIALTQGWINEIRWTCIPEGYPHPTGWWPLNSMYQAFDVSGYNNHGTLYNAKLSEGPHGETDGSYYLSGELDSYINIENKDGSLDYGRKSWTWMGWVDIKGSEKGPIFHFGDKSGSLYGLDIWQESTTLFQVADNSRSDNSNQGNWNKDVLTQHRWNHLAFTYNYASGELKMYKSGVHIQTDNINQRTWGTQHPVYIGAHNSVAVKGKFSCIKFWSVAVSSKDIIKHMDRCNPEGSTVFETWKQPIAWWPFTKAHGGQDVSGRNNHMQLFDVLYDYGPNGEKEGSVYFKGEANSYGLVKNDGDLDIRFSITAMFQIKILSSSSLGPILQFRYPPQSHDWGLLLAWHHPQLGSIYTASRKRADSSGDDWSRTTNSILDPGIWTHITITWNFEDGNYKIYKNGILFGEENKVKTELLTIYDLRLGTKPSSSGDTKYLKAYMHCIKIWDYALDAVEVWKWKDKCQPETGTDFRQGFASGGQPSPVAFWMLNRQHGTRDLSGNGNHGTTTNTDLKTGPLGESEGAFYFKKQADSGVFVPRSETVDIRRSFTFTTFMKIGSLSSGNNYILRFPPPADGNTGNGLHFMVSSNSIMFKLNKRTVNGDSLGECYKDSKYDFASKVGKWLHVATTYDYATGLQRDYLDGELIGGCDHGQSVDLDMDGELYIGTCDAISGCSAFFDGSLSCIQMYDVALSRSQLLDSMRLCGPEGQPRPLGMWPLDARYGGSDVSGYGNTASLTGVSAVDVPEDTLNTAHQFDGSISSYVEFPNNESDKIDARYSFTYMVNIKPDLDQESGPLFNFEIPENPISSYGLHVWVTSGSSLFVRLNHRDGSWPNAYGPNIVTKGQWNRLAVTYSFKTGLLIYYKDGEEFTRYFADRIESNTLHTARAGYRGYDDVRFYKGLMECVQFYDVTLTQEQIKTAMGFCTNPGDDRVFHHPESVPLGQGLPSLYNFKSFPSRSILTCLRACGDAKTCLSMNYIPTPGTCELNDISLRTDPSLNFEEKNCNYYEMTHPAKLNTDVLYKVHGWN